MNHKLYTTHHHHIVMKSEPRNMADTVSYMLKGELCSVLDWKYEHQQANDRMNTNFVHVKLNHDGYTGYVLSGQVIPVTKTHHNAYLRPVFPMTKNGILQAATPYMESPYLWGGRTAFGIDCSGLTQQIYKKLGIQLARDAYQQAEQGEIVGYEQHMSGDLVFFEEIIGSGKIKHVGIVIEPGKILHASEQGPANVRINNVTPVLIINDNGHITNHYVMTRRYKPTP